MAYTSAAEVSALTGSSLSTTAINAIIDIADAQLDATLAREGLSITGSTPALVAVASLFLSTAMVLERQRADGTMADSTGVGDITITAKLEEQLAGYRAGAEAHLNQYIAAQKGDDYTCTFERAQSDNTDKD
ncbi:MAG: hypothetical protein ACXQS9_00630 [Methermicoccaceae archaeon]